MIQIFIQGLLLQASLILALGAQNLYVLEAGLKRKKHLLIATVCAACDTVLILLGVIGFTSVFLKLPILKIGFGMLGVGFLFYYGILKLKEFLHPALKSLPNEVREISNRQVLMATLGFSLLNPHVYLDTLVLIGSYSSKFSLLNSRIAFGLGAALTSWIWFFGLALLASAGNRLIHNQLAMRMIALASGLILITLAAKLGIDVYGWSNHGLSLTLSPLSFDFT